MIEAECCENPICVISQDTIVCTSCGTVVQNRLVDPGQDWTSFADNDQDNTRADVFADPVLTSLGTGVSKNKFGSNQPSEPIYHKPRTTDEKNKDRLSEALQRLKQLIATMQIPEMLATGARQILLKHDNIVKGTKRGTLADPFLLAVILLACHNTQSQIRYGLTIEDASKRTGIDQKEIVRNYKWLRIQECSVAPSSIPLKIEDLARNFGNRLGYSFMETTPVVQRAMEYAEQLEGRKPATVAGAAFLSVYKDMTAEKRKLLSNITSVSLKTLETVARKMFK